MNHKRIIMLTKLQIILAEYHLDKGHLAKADSCLYRIYNLIHFGKGGLTPKQKRNRPPGKLKK